MITYRKNTTEKYKIQSKIFGILTFSLFFNRKTFNCLKQFVSSRFSLIFTILLRYMVYNILRIINDSLTCSDLTEIFGILINMTKMRFKLSTVWNFRHPLFGAHSDINLFVPQFNSTNQRFRKFWKVFRRHQIFSYIISNPWNFTFWSTEKKHLMLIFYSLDFYSMNSSNIGLMHILLSLFG